MGTIKLKHLVCYYLLLTLIVDITRSNLNFSESGKIQRSLRKIKCPLRKKMSLQTNEKLNGLFRTFSTMTKL